MTIQSTLTVTNVDMSIKYTDERNIVDPQLALVELVEQYLKGTHKLNFNLTLEGSLPKSSKLPLPLDYMGDDATIHKWFLSNNQEVIPIFLLSSGDGMDSWKVLLDKEGNIINMHSSSLDAYDTIDYRLDNLTEEGLVLFLLLSSDKFKV